MTRYILTLVCATVLTAPRASAQEAPPAGGAETKAATTRPASAPASQPADEKVLKILKDLEKAGEAYSTLKADMTYRVVNKMLGDQEARTGWVAYRKAAEGVPPGLRISFETLALDEGRKIDEKVDYAFDGKQLSIARHKIKQINRYRIPDAQARRPMKLGEGPFPLPFGQKAEDMLAHFRVTTRPPGEGDPKDTDYLRLLPRDDGEDEANVARIEMWIDGKTHLPVKIVSIGKDKTETTVELTAIQTNAKLDNSVFTITKPFTWHESIENLEKGAKLTP